LTAERLYADVVAPAMAAAFPDVGYAAARIGTGSDVLGVDDEISRDHDWGGRLTVLVDDPGPVAAVLPDGLDVIAVDDFAVRQLGVIPVTAVDWLVLTGQSVLEVSEGTVFRDDEGKLDGLRQRLVWYPDDVWRYTVASAWAQVGQELPFVGRTGHRGDDAGSRIIAARLVQVLRHLAFLLDRVWPPYPKWTGTLATRLPCWPRVGPHLATALAATEWQDRERGLADTIRALAHHQASTGLPTIEDPVIPFWGRPFVGIDPGLYDAILESIQDPEVRRLPRGVGSLEQWITSVDVLSNPQRRATLTDAYRALMP
jgi:hypothetical protein